MFALFFCFLLPLLGAFRFNLVGEITLAEPFVILYFLISSRKILDLLFKRTIPRRMFLLILTLLLALIVADLYRGTPSIDFLRGWSKTGMLLVSYGACAVLVGTDLNRAGALIAGIFLQPVVNYFFYHPDIPAYKFVFGYFVSVAAFGVAYLLHGERRVWPSLFPVGAGAIALLMDSRSLAGITLCATAYYTMLSMRMLGEERGWRSRMIFGLFWLGLSLSVVTVYSTLAKGGHLSEKALDKYENQLDSSGRFSVFAGRTEIFFSLPKIVESPLIGWGSWAKDPIYVAERAEALGMDAGRAVQETGGLIPTHSHLMGSLLEAGFFGGLIWMYALYLILRIFTSGWIKATGRWSGVLTFVMILFSWDILFSPFGGERRLNNGLYLWLVTMIALVSTERRLMIRRAQAAAQAAQAALRRTSRRLAPKGNPPPPDSTDAALET